MDRVDIFRIFTRVVETNSFTKAAATLDMPRSTVSTAIAILEARLGTKLLSRTTRKVSTTRDGMVFYERCMRLIADLEEAESLFRSSGQNAVGKLHIDLPGRVGRLIVAPALPNFLARFPDLDLQLGVSDRAVDLIGENVDCALRVGPLRDSELIARHVGNLPFINVASPAYLEKHGVPLRPTDLLKGHRIVAYASPTTGRLEEWEWEDDSDTHSIAVPHAVTVNNAEAYIACCLAGLGLIQIPAYDVEEELVSGALVEVMPGHRVAPIPMTLLYPHRHHLSHRVQIFSDWLITLLRTRIRFADA